MSLLEKNSDFTSFAEQKIHTLASIKEKLKGLRKSGKQIVTINGSFDLLHEGHLHMLYEASMQGDVLVVALNTDSSIRGYKGDKRPIIPLEGRMRMMAALQMVDFVISFDEPDPRRVLREIEPDVHVNGSEYGENCIEADVVKASGGRIHIVSLLPGFSTSKLIERIVHLVSS